MKSIPRPLTDQSGFTLIQVMVVAGLLGITTVFLSETVRYIVRQTAGTRLLVTRDQLVSKIRQAATSPRNILLSGAAAGNSAHLGACTIAAPTAACGPDGTELTDPPVPSPNNHSYELHTYILSPTNVKVDTKISEHAGTVPPTLYYTQDGEICGSAVASATSDEAKLACPFVVYTSYYAKCGYGGCPNIDRLGFIWQVIMRTDYPVTANRFGGAIPDAKASSEEVYWAYFMGYYYSLLDLIQPGKVLGYPS